MTSFAGPQTRLIWVDVTSGNDADARRSRIDKPFKTIQAALNAAIAGDTLNIAPGTYLENLVMPDKDGLALIGACTTTTIITAAVGSTITWVPAAGPGALVQSFLTENLTITNSDPAAGVDTIRVDGSAVVSPNTFLQEWFMHDCIVDKTGGGTGVTMNITCIGRIITSLTDYISKDVRLRNVGRFGATQCSLASFDFGWDRTGGAAQPGTGREGYYLNNSTFVSGNGVLSGNPIFAIDNSTTISGNLTATALTSFAAGLDAPIITIAGTLGTGLGTTPAGGGTFAVTLPTEAGAIPPALNLAQGRFWGAITTSKSAGARNTVNARGAIFYNTVSSGALIDLDIRNATFAQAAVSAVGGGTVDRTTWVLQARAVAIAGTVIPIVPPYPATVTTQYTPVPVCTTAAPTPVGITARSASQFTATSVAATTCDFVLTRAA